MRITIKSTFLLYFFLYIINILIAQETETLTFRVFEEDGIKALFDAKVDIGVYGIENTDNEGIVTFHNVLINQIGRVSIQKEGYVPYSSFLSSLIADPNNNKTSINIKLTQQRQGEGYFIQGILRDVKENRLENEEVVLSIEGKKTQVTMSDKYGIFFFEMPDKQEVNGLVYILMFNKFILKNNEEDAGEKKRMKKSIIGIITRNIKGENLEVIILTEDDPSMPKNKGEDDLLDFDKDGIPDIKDACIEEYAPNGLCGCPREMPLNLKFYSRLEMHPRNEAITILKWSERKNKLLSGGDKGKFYTSSLDDEKGLISNKASLALPKQANPREVKELASPSQNLMLLTDEKLIELKIGERTLKTERTIKINTKNYETFDMIEDRIFFSKKGVWYNTFITESRNFSSTKETSIIAIGKNFRDEYYFLDKNKTLNVFEGNSPPVKTNFNISTPILHLVSSDNGSWATLNSNGEIESTDTLCNCSYPEINKRIKSIKWSKNLFVIAFLFEGGSIEIWQKHSVVNSWQEIKTGTEIEENLKITSIEISRDGHHLFIGTPNGTIGHFKIIN